MADDESTGAEPAITIAGEALAELRAQVRSLLGLIDTGRKPDPAGIVPPGKRNAGPVWKPAAKWEVRAIDDDAGGEGEVYVTTPLDWEGDYQAMTVDGARALAMSILAACDWAEAGPPAKGKAYQVLDEDGRRSRRTFICGGG